MKKRIKLTPTESVVRQFAGKISISTAVSAALMCWGAPAFSQVAAATAQDGQKVEEMQAVVVSGTRLRVVNGNQAPTPVSTISLGELQAQVPKDLTDVVTQIPSIAGSMTPAGRSAQASNGTNGISAPALRGLGSNRTLVLLDGQRSVPVTQTGETDLMNIPQQLVKRVDVVTGGASAAYGSDALAGVINFVLDKKFTGVKGEVSAGQSTYHDDKNWKGSLTGGWKFADGRGHFLLSGEHARNLGVFGNETGARPPRDWQYDSRGILANPAYTPTNGTPQYIVVPHYNSAAATKGGLIVDTALRGTAFDANGQPYQFNFGRLDKVAPGGIPLYMSGGNQTDSNISGMQILQPLMKRDGLFTRVSFDLDDRTTVYAQGSYNESETRGGLATYIQQGDLTISADNAFLPASVAARARELGITSFKMGMVKPGERAGAYVERQVKRVVLGTDSRFDAFGSTWDISAYYQIGQTDANEQGTGLRIVSNYNQAIDSVINPATGAPICRSTLTNPNNGCVPFNVFGWQALPEAVNNYAFGGGNPTRLQKFRQDVAAVTVRGEPFSNWAGPVSMATGLEHRKEAGSGTVDDRSGPPTQWGTQFLPLNGRYTVKEAFVEAGVPLAKDRAFAKSLDFNTAVRVTDYSVSGNVVTWKLGTVWAPVDDLRFRLTRSHDIRAPNLAELFTKGLQTISAVRDPFRNNLQSSLATVVTVGNLSLEPEKANTWAVGMVLEPRFLPGFSTSIDYYKIDVSGAIGTVSSQQILDSCHDGQAVFCPAIDRASSGAQINGLTEVTRVRNSFFNFANQLARGVDVEANYRLNSSWNFRVFGTKFLENKLASGITPTIDIVGDMQPRFGSPATGAIPNWKATGSITYDTKPLTATLAVRALSDGYFGAASGAYIVCSSNCPPSTAANPTIDQNHVAGAVYFDASITYRPQGRASSGNPEFFFGIHNIANKDPAIVPRGPSGQAYGTRPTNDWAYDMIGRTFQAGVRFAWK
jgi:outer membrane receptor protein involved in Fe transport